MEPWEEKEMKYLMVREDLEEAVVHVVPSVVYLVLEEAEAVTLAVMLVMEQTTLLEEVEEGLTTKEPTQSMSQDTT